MDLTRLNYRPFRRRQYARKGASKTYQRFESNGPIQEGKFWRTVLIIRPKRDETSGEIYEFERIPEKSILSMSSDETSLRSNTNSTPLPMILARSLMEKKLFLKGK